MHSWACLYADVYGCVHMGMCFLAGSVPVCVHICVPGLCIGVYVEVCELDCSRLGVWACRLSLVST